MGINKKKLNNEIQYYRENFYLSENYKQNISNLLETLETLETYKKLKKKEKKNVWWKLQYN
jgi:hypothetical protein